MHYPPPIAAQEPADLLVRGDFVLPMTDGLPELHDAAVAVGIAISKARA